VTATPSLESLIATETQRPLPFAVESFVAAVREKFGDAAQAVLFYGSCRRVDQPDGLYDLYVVIDRYGALPVYEAIVGWLLPPNVYHLQVEAGGRTRRAKCTVISMADFRRGTSKLWFHTYLWGRFSQAVSIAWVRDEASRTAVLDCLATAVRTFLSRSLCLVPGNPDVEAIWVEGMRASYGTELRSEGKDRASEIFRHNAAYYDAVTHAAAPDVAGLRPRHDGTFEIRADEVGGLGAWHVRRVTGKLLSVARILKAWTTFHGGLDYLVWKLSRHSGQEIVVPDAVRRRPLLHVWGFLWRLYRQGAFR
jgi:hypothetical protein